MKYFKRGDGMVVARSDEQLAAVKELGLKEATATQVKNWRTARAAKVKAREDAKDQALADEMAAAQASGDFLQLAKLARGTA